MPCRRGGVEVPTTTTSLFPDAFMFLSTSTNKIAMRLYKMTGSIGTAQGVGEQTMKGCWGVRRVWICDGDSHLVGLLFRCGPTGWSISLRRYVFAAFSGCFAAIRNASHAPVCVGPWSLEGPGEIVKL